jgi:hypothetical protein
MSEQSAVAPSTPSRDGSTRGVDRELTLWEAFKDIGWLPLLLMGLGGLSILDAAEKAAAHSLSLIAPLQSILDGYHRIAKFMGDVVEPWVSPLVTQIGQRFGWHLHIDALWRPIFIIAMITVSGWSRTLWRRGDRRFAIIVLATLTPSVFAGSIACGLLSLTDGVWPQVLLAVLPTVALWASTGVAFAINAMLASKFGEAWRALVKWAGHTLVTATAVSLASVLLYYIPQTRMHAGVVALAGVVAYLGVFYLRQGLRTADIFYSRLGLSLLGGFAAAGLVLAADWLAKAAHLGHS